MKLTQYVQDVLPHEAVLAYVRDHPACKPYDIQLELHMSKASVGYHLRKLREAGLVASGLVAL